MQIRHCNVFHFLRYAQFRYRKCFFTNLRKQNNMLKSSILFNNNKTLRVNNCRILKIKNAEFNAVPLKWKGRIIFCCRLFHYTGCSQWEVKLTGNLMWSEAYDMMLICATQVMKAYNLLSTKAGYCSIARKKY